jgi:enamine deaminase RidA (YjgF/YER057c/UK114 family)
MAVMTPLGFDHRHPAGTLVEVKGLIYPELLIEIEAVAIVHDGP